MTVQHTPEKYGYLSVRVGSQSAIEQNNALFLDGAIGSTLGIAQAIKRVRFAADIYTTMLEVGVYMWHAASVLKVNGEVMARIAQMDFRFGSTRVVQLENRS